VRRKPGTSQSIYLLVSNDIQLPDTRIPQFGSYLKARREARGLTQRALAERIGVTPQRISLVELNQAALSLPQCTAAAEALGADQTELLAMAGHIEPRVYAAIVASSRFWRPLIEALEAPPGDIDAWQPVVNLADRYGIMPENCRGMMGLLARLRRALDNE
jgi:HTH-type transcriptional regulator / antitoxin HipB